MPQPRLGKLPSCPQIYMRLATITPACDWRSTGKFNLRQPYHIMLQLFYAKCIIHALRWSAGNILIFEIIIIEGTRFGCLQSADVSVRPAVVYQLTTDVWCRAVQITFVENRWHSQRKQSATMARSQCHVHVKQPWMALQLYCACRRTNTQSRSPTLVLYFFVKVHEMHRNTLATLPRVARSGKSSMLLSVV